MSNVSKQQYNSAKLWQIGLFALNNTATNVIMSIMTYLAIFSQNILGIAAVTIGVVITSMRIFDGITDPIIGYMIDKTETKFGKYRPFMLVGNIILLITVYLIFGVVPNLSKSMRFPVLLGIYVIYIIGYTFQTACTKAAQASLTNDPKQRPLFTIFDSIYNSILFSVSALVITSILPPMFADGYENGLLNPEMWKMAAIIFGGTSFVMTILAIIGISGRDKKEFYGVGSAANQVKFKDYWPIIKSNRAIQMLVIAASTDKLASTLANATKMYLFGNVLMNISLQGEMSVITTPVTIIITIIGVRYASKLGQKKAFVAGTWLSMAMLFAMIIIQPFDNVSMTNINLNTILFLSITILQGAFAGISGNIVIPMIADCADYETYRTGKFVPGMMGTLFSFIDKLISSFSSTLLGVGLAIIGMANAVIVPNTPADTKFFWLIMTCMYIVPIFGHIASIIAMKFYPLDAAKMAEVQSGLNSIKEKQGA
ncbi:MULTISPECIES: MFS transporter [Romboutsia]|uniref:Sugar/sodium symporter n=1 Tax=Romboutsia hominis TaxID=1507512 RepID=A0A2P2BSI6_9FIRM|nr:MULTISPECIES: MFS transporter [Romboutsia]MCH1960585.1 MFS transporter [Romboutsia hominis]MCH1968983.1 MFS transporter [Romboutsia hominis]MDB8790278.1 MFS transporter [Romboutsia sp. 1001216sp1]MDB8793525.1 MFS transporter [Romboutsia sp. 1001216sp1]MDB8797067.1 MFS transporter [Romboutsia sp. 1001216sp1]